MRSSLICKAFAFIIFAILMAIPAIAQALDVYYSSDDVIGTVNGSAYVGEDDSEFHSKYDLRTGLFYNPTVLLNSQSSVSGAVISYNNSTVNMTGGNVGNSIFLDDSSTLNMSRGTVGSNVYAVHGGKVNISGGVVNGDLQTFLSTHLTQPINSAVDNCRYSGGTLWSWTKVYLTSTRII